MIISYHFKFGNTPKYNFGIIVTEKDKGKLIKPWGIEKICMIYH